MHDKVGTVTNVENINVENINVENINVVNINVELQKWPKDNNINKSQNGETRRN